MCIVIYFYDYNYKLIKSHCPGFDLIEVGMDEVTLRTGKQANKRSIQFVLQALLALFGKFTLRLINRVIFVNFTLYLIDIYCFQMHRHTRSP